MPPAAVTPDEHHRAWRQLLITAAAAAAVIVLGKLWGLPWLTRYLTTPDPAVTALHFMRVMQGFAVVLLLTALGAARLAWRILRSGQVPPPGAWGLRRAPRTGREARAAGVILALCAAGLVALAVFALQIPGRALSGRAAHAARQAGGSAR